jgi:hypothetical protein
MHAQTTGTRNMQWCGALNCEEQVIRTVAMDSAIRLLRDTRQIDDRGPRVLSTLYFDPLHVRSGALPVDRIDGPEWGFSRRLYPELTVVDSVGAAFTPAGVLTAGAPLFVVSPVSWRGDSAAVVRLAVFPGPRQRASELYVRLEYREARWRAVAIEYGRQE